MRQINIQPIEKTNFNEDGNLDIHSIFRTIQGEGPFTGQGAIFVRLAGCNLQCPQCDTEYTERKNYSIYEATMLIVKQRLHKMIDLVVITGGEPFRQNLIPLVNRLLEMGLTVQIETNGTLYQSLPFGHNRLVVVCSPKTGIVNKSLQPYIKAYKYVISASDYDVNDGLPNHALGHACKRLARPQDFTAPVYIQPADEKDSFKNADNLQIAIANAIKFGYILCIQTHKIIGVE